jgi:hypothetical protein
MQKNKLNGNSEWCLYIEQEFVTELPTSPALGKFYMEHKFVLFQKIEVWISGLSVKDYDQ